MLGIYVDRCAPVSAYLAVQSLDAPANDNCIDPDHSPSLVETLPDLTIDIERTVDASRIKGTVATFMASLTSRQRQVATAIFWEGMTQAEVANDLGVSPAAISKTIARVKRRGQAFFPASFSDR